MGKERLGRSPEGQTSAQLPWETTPGKHEQVCEEASVLLLWTQLRGGCAEL